MVLSGFGVRLEAKQYQMKTERAKGKDKDDEGQALYEEGEESKDHYDDRNVC